MEHKRPSKYRTRQGQCILDYVRSLGGRHVTAGQMARHFENTGDFIGQTTIYRHLERLAAEGLIRKYVLDGGSACYQYSGNSREQYHLVCEICGGLIHVNCDFLDKIGRHFLKRHDFQINMLKTVFYGTCKKCRAGA